MAWREDRQPDGPDVDTADRIYADPIAVAPGPKPRREPAPASRWWWLAGGSFVAVALLVSGVLMSFRGPGKSAVLPPPQVPVVLQTAAVSPSVVVSPSVGVSPSVAVSSLVASAPSSSAPAAVGAAVGAANPSGANLALNRAATASGSEGVAWGPGNAVDGNAESRWSSAFSDPQWISVDLGSLRQISQVKLTWERSYAVAYRVQVSTDGRKWKTVFSTAGGRGGVVSIDAGKVSGRYVRVFGSKRVTGYGYSLFELAVR